MPWFVEKVWTPIKMWAQKEETGHRLMSNPPNVRTPEARSAQPKTNPMMKAEVTVSIEDRAGRNPSYHRQHPPLPESSHRIPRDLPPDGAT